MAVLPDDGFYEIYNSFFRQLIYEIPQLFVCPFLVRYICMYLPIFRISSGCIDRSLFFYFCNRNIYDPDYFNSFELLSCSDQ